MKTVEVVDDLGHFHVLLGMTLPVKAYFADNAALLCIGQDGECYYPFMNQWFKIGFVKGDDIKEIHCDIDKTSIFGLTKEGRVFSWGDNSLHELGHAVVEDDEELLFDPDNDSNENGKPAYWAPNWINISENIKVEELAVGTSHVLALTTDGIVYSWGHNGRGQLGHGAYGYGDALWLSVPTPTPIPMSQFDESRVIQVATSASTSVVLTEKKEVFYWGTTPQEMIIRPRLMKSTVGFTQIGCSSLHCFFLSETNQLYVLCFNCDCCDPVDQRNPFCGSRNPDTDIQSEGATFHIIKIPCQISSIISNPCSDTVTCLGSKGSVLTVRRDEKKDDVWVCGFVVGK